MRSNLATANIPFGVAGAREIDRQNSTPTGKIAVRPIFGDVAKVVWQGEKPSVAIAEIADTNLRTAERWLSGESDPPPCVVAAMLARIFPQRG
jgi:hypothetical protein